LQTNGYTLARKVFFEEMGLKPDSSLKELGGRAVGDALLDPHLSYLKPLQPLLEARLVHAMAHLTGGGFYDNIPRVLPEGLDVVVKSGAWPVPPIFELIEREGRVSFEEMHRVFNMGIGMAVFVAAADLARAGEIWKAMGQRWFAIGNVKANGSRRVIVEPAPGVR
jgi:phosphoribosylformylglycinamidine cyclo-ligase